MGEHRIVGERLVAAARPRFKDFRVDFEKISNAASKAAREGREGLRPDDAMAMFSDLAWDLRIPLQHRYAAEGAFDAVVHYHSKRFKLYLGRNTAWPDEPAQEALALLATHGRADLGIRLIRTYVDMQHKRLKRDYSLRNPRKPQVDRPEGVQQAIDGISKLIAAGIPESKAGLLRDLDGLAPYVDRHGGEDDRQWLEQERRAIWMEKRA